jgi:hypothetical protein
VKYRRFAVLALGVLAFAAAGCGGDDSSSEAASDTQAAESTTVEDTTTEMTEDTTSEDTTSDDTATSLDDIDLGDLSGDCLAFAGIGTKIAQAMGGASGTNADLSKTADLFDELVASAPDEIKDDLQVISEGVAKLAEALKGTDIASGATPSADQLAKLQAALASVDSEALQAASKNVEAWALDNCKK